MTFFPYHLKLMFIWQKMRLKCTGQNMLKRATEGLFCVPILFLRIVFRLIFTGQMCRCSTNYCDICRRKEKYMDNEILTSEKAQLYVSSLGELMGEQKVIDYGAIIICRQGTATMRIDFKCWRLEEGAVITLFPNDVVQMTDASADFEIEMLRYCPAQLREASLQLEQTIYDTLRKDRCRGKQPVVGDIVNGMFNLLRIYFDQPECKCTDQLVLYQLKSSSSASMIGLCATNCRTNAAMHHSV